MGQGWQGALVRVAAGLLSWWRRDRTVVARKPVEIRDVILHDLEQHQWSQAMGYALAGYERSSLVLVALKSRLYLILIEREAYEKVAGSDLLQRFERGMRVTQRLECKGIFQGSTEEVLLLQTHLQRDQDDQAKINEHRSGAFRNFDLMIDKAIQAGASDVHLEFRESAHVSVRFRVHGKLRPTSVDDRLSRNYASMLDAVSAAYNARADSASRSHNHFDETQHQSCSIPVAIRGRAYQLRFQSVRENRGVDVVLRVLLNEAIENDVLSLAQLGYAVDQIDVLEDAVHRSPGLTIIAGETGSGKSTTLRTLMSYERDSGKKFFSIEDPVEYIQPHLTQIPIQRRAEESGESAFGAAAKVVLRADPDKLMPGEIRDAETASFAKAMTETGHQVLSTIHASSAFGILARLTSDEIGMPLEAVAGSKFLTAMVYQKLVPVLCDECKVAAEHAFDPLYLRLIDSLSIDVARVYATGPGCARCQFRGTAAQTVVAEVCQVTDEMLVLVRKREFWQAEQQWRSAADGCIDSANMRGKTAMEHALYKMAHGLVDPMDIESGFYKLRNYKTGKLT